MSLNALLQVAIFLSLIVVLTRPVGMFLTTILEGRRTFLHHVLRPLEVATYRIVGVNEAAEQRWTQYAGSLLAFSLVNFSVVYLIQRLQGVLPLNPQALPSSIISPDRAFNTAVSFVTNTNLQSYAGESTLSYLVQMGALAVQNFASAAAGIALAAALIRGFVRQRVNSLGSFWVDITRATIYFLLPLCLCIALFFCSQGVIQNLHPSTAVKTIEGHLQTIAQGPVASQEAIKLLGTGGGGFFKANSAHPLENPTPLSNLVHMILVFLIPSGLTYMLGQMLGDPRKGWTLFWACAGVFMLAAFVSHWFEQSGNPILASIGLDNRPSISQCGGNMEGKETRFGIAGSTFSSVANTHVSCGAANSIVGSFTPLSQLMLLLNLQAGQLKLGGAGAGMFGLILHVVLAAFIGALLAGAFPEYGGKLIEQKEMKLVMLALIAVAFSTFVFSAASATVLLHPEGARGNGQQSGSNGSVHPVSTSHTDRRSVHRFTQNLYAYTSATGNSGSALTGSTVNSPWFNVTLGLAMLIGRFLFLIPMLACAGSLAMKRKATRSSGALCTHGFRFALLLVFTTVITGSLVFFPALLVGPILEHLLVSHGLFSMFLFSLVGSIS
jgi:K+-transporting ATPase ATPase A chain